MKLTTHAQLSIEDQSWGHLHSTQKPHQPGREFECTYAFDSSLGLRVPCRTGQFWRIPVQLSYPTISGILWRRWCTLCFRKKRLGTYVWSWANLVGASHKPKESFCLLLAIGYLEGLQDPCPMTNRYINASWLVAKFNANWNTCICHSYLFLPRHDARVLNPHEWSIHVAFTHLC